MTTSEDEPTEHDLVTLREWAEYEFATTEYDYNIHPRAAATIRSILDRYIGSRN